MDGVGNKPIAVRGAATTAAEATDFCHELGLSGVTTLRKTVRYKVDILQYASIFIDESS